MLTTADASEKEKSVADALIQASKDATRDRKRNDAFWLAMARAAIKACK